MPAGVDELGAQSPVPHVWLATRGPRASVVRANAACVGLLGASSERQVVDEAPELFGSAIETFASLGDDASAQAEIRTCDGRTLHVLATASDRTGERVVGFLDISPWKRLEEQLRSAQRMEVLGQLAGGVAHDFNNLLSAIDSYAGFLFEDLAPGSSSQSDVQVIRDASRRAAALVGQLLAYTRRRPQELQTFDVNRSLQGIEGMLARTIGEDIVLSVQPADVPLTVHADVDQLEQAVILVVLQGRTNMPDGGHLTIRAERAVVEEEAPGRRTHLVPGEYVRITFVDDGPARSADELEALFDPFSRPAGTVRLSFGLATARGIAEQHGGGIRAEGEPGVGTRFELFLPAVDGLGTSPRRPLASGGDLGGEERVLLCDDDELVRRAAVRILERGGYRVVACESAPEALRRFAAEPDGFAALVTDLVMPHMGGEELAAGVRAVRADLPVMFMSGYSERPSGARPRPSGPAVAFLQKPFDRRSFLTRLRTLLDG